MLDYQSVTSCDIQVVKLVRIENRLQILPAPNHDLQSIVLISWRIQGDKRYMYLHESLIFMVNVGEYISTMDPMGISFYYLIGAADEWVRNCFGNSFFFFRDLFFFFWLGVVLGLSRLLFGKTQGWKAGSCGFFRTFGGGFRAVQAPFWGNQWWNAGSIQVWTQKTASKSKLSRSFLFSVCIYLCWCVCVCLW